MIMGSLILMNKTSLLILILLLKYDTIISAIHMNNQLANGPELHVTQTSFSNKFPYLTNRLSRSNSS